MSSKYGKLVFTLVIVAILLAAGAATIWLTRHPAKAGQMLGLDSGAPQESKEDGSQNEGASNGELVAPTDRSEDVVRFNGTKTTAQMSPEMSRRFGADSGAVAEDEDKDLEPDEAAEAIKADAEESGTEDAAEDGSDPAPSAPERAGGNEIQNKFPRLATNPEPAKTSKAELRIAIAKAIASSDSAQRIMRIEDHVAALRTDMSGMKDAMATLLERTAPGNDEEAAKEVPATTIDTANTETGNTGATEAAAEKGDDENVEKKIDDSAGSDGETKEKDYPEALVDPPKDSPKVKASTDGEGKPDHTEGPSSIESIKYETTGDDTAIVTFHLAGNAYPRTRLMTGNGKAWAVEKDWAAIDFFGTSIDTKLPTTKGIIRRAKIGKHGSYVRVLFETTQHRLMKANVEGVPGVVTLALARAGKATPRKKSYGHRKKTQAKATKAEVKRWTIRAISAGAAVIYDGKNGTLLSLREGSRVPSMGVVTGIHPTRGVVETSQGRIRAGS